MKLIKVEQTPTTFLIPADDLRAAFHCVSKEEARYNIKGVCVTQTETGVKLVSTNGHTMLVIQTPDGAFIGEKCFTQEGAFILDTDTTHKAFKAKTAMGLWVYGDVETGILQFVDYTPSETDADFPRMGVCEFQRIDGTFPNWQCIEAKPATSENCQYVCFDPALLTQMTKAADVFEKGKGVRIMPTDTPVDPYRVEFEASSRITGTLVPKRWASS